MNDIKRPVLRYFGEKARIASWIISHFPAHTTYVEPYSGAASVLLKKPPSSVEVLNDKFNRIAKLYRVLRDPTMTELLETALIFTPYSHNEYINCRGESPDPLEDARRMIVLGHQSHGSMGGGKLSGWRRGVRQNGPHSGENWKGLHSQLKPWADRLRSVFIEESEALDCINKWDGPDTLFYVDPPYLASTRKSNGKYAHEMDEEQHVLLSETLKNVKGKVIISGYQSGLYDRLYKGWEISSKAAMADKARPRTEILWIKK